MTTTTARDKYDIPDPLATAEPRFTEEWLEGPQKTSFYTRTYDPENREPQAFIVFIHGFQEHISRYEHVFHRLSSAPHNFSVFAFDQRGWGRTALDEVHRTPGAQYGKTTRPEQLEDMECFVKRETERASALGKKTFLYGHSMGGGLVLNFGTAKQAPPSEETILSLAGIIASSPMTQMAKPAAKPLRLVGSVLAKAFPSMRFPAKVPAEDLTHASAVIEAAKEDPLMKTYATVGAINDMLASGDHLTHDGWRDWPKSMPLLVFQGDADKVCSFPSTKAFYDKITADDKHFIEFEGAYHEVHNETDFWIKAIDDVAGWIKQRKDGKRVEPIENVTVEHATSHL